MRMKRGGRRLDEGKPGSIPEPLLLALLFLATFLAHTLYIFVFMSPESYLGSDMGEYDQRAESFSEGKVPWMAAFYPPFYHIFLGSAYAVLKAAGIYALKYNAMVAIHAFLSAFGTVFVYLISKKMFGERAALLSALLYAFSYQTLYLNAWLMSENLLVPVFLAAVYVAVCRLDTKPDYALLGLLLGIAAITRTAVLIVFPIFAVWMLANRKDKKDVLVFTVVFALVLGAQILYNYGTTNGEEKFLASNGGVNFAFLHCGYKEIRFEGGGYAAYFIPPAHGKYFNNTTLLTGVPLTNASYFYGLGLECIRQDPVKRIADWQNVAYLFDSQFFPIAGGIPYQDGLFAVAKALNYLVLMPFSVYCLFACRGKRGHAVLLAAVFASFLLACYALFPGEERYLVPYYFVFFILGGAGLLKAAGDFTKRRG